MSTESQLAGVNLDRRSAMAMGSRLAATVMIAAFTPPFLSACSGQTAPSKDYRPLVMTLLDIVIPGSAQASNADFVARAASRGMMGVPADMLGQVELVLDGQGGGAFSKRPRNAQIEAVRKIDAETFAPGAVRPAPWYSTKALLLMAFYTSEDGMTKQLRYELVPGRYDADIVVDPAWRPLSNDWQGVVINGGIVGK